MPFISTIRSQSNVQQPEKAISESIYEITGGDKVYTAGGYTIHMFTTVGEHQLNVKVKEKYKDLMKNLVVVPASSGVVEYLVIGGGGSGGMGLSTNGNGGGGAGGYLTGSTPVSGNIPVTVGGGGGPYPYNGSTPGSSSNFGPITGTYGGQGGYYYGAAGGYGGSGGGAAYGYSAGSSAPGQGNPGSPYTYTWSGGGGGGSSQAGQNHQGGLGSSSSITGSSVARAGGGGGGGNSSEPGGDGASGGGRGHGSTPNWGYSYYTYSQDPRGGWGVTHAYTANSGSGGGAGSYWAPNIGWYQGGGYGASGLVVVRYPS
jgi:hypothetical protein